MAKRSYRGGSKRSYGGGVRRKSYGGKTGVQRGGNTTRLVIQHVFPSGGDGRVADLGAVRAPSPKKSVF